MSESHQFVPVALWLKFLRGPTCALHYRWTFALCARGHWNRVLLCWPVRGWNRQRGSVAAIHGQTRASLRAAGMLSGAESVAKELDQEGVEGSDTGTADEWLSFCDGGFPSVVRVEDLGFIGIVVRFTQGGVEAAVPSGAATAGMPDAVAVQLSSEPSGEFATVNLLELTGDSSDRLVPLEEKPVELMGFDDGGRLPLQPQLLEVSRAQLGTSSASVAATAPSARKRASSKRALLSRTPKPSTPKAARRSPANAFQELVVDRLEELSGRLSLLETPDKGAFASPTAQQGFSQKSIGPGSRSSLAGGLTVPSVLGRSAPSLSGPAACAQARASAAWKRSRSRTHDQVPATPVRL